MGTDDSTDTSSTVTDASSAQFKTAAPEMGGYANERDPSWEDVVAMVVIPGNPNAIYQAAADWRVLLSRVADVERVLKEILHDLEDWKGAGGEEYRSHLTDMLSKVKQIGDTYTELPHLLDRAGNDVRDAIAAIPIPADMIHEVDAAKSNYLANGTVTGPFFPGSFYQKLLPIYKNKWLDGLIETQPLLNWASNKLRDWISDNDDKAKDAYGRLAGFHLTTMDDIKGGGPSVFDKPREPRTDFDPTKLGGPGGHPAMPNTKLPDTSNPKLNDPNLNNPNLNDPSLNNPSLTDPGLGNPGTGDDLPGTGLAGAGGDMSGLPGGGGLGTGGLGPAGGGGLGAGGLGGGLGAGSLRGAGGLGGMMPGVGMGGMGAGAGAGKGGARAAGKALGRGGVAGMGGHGGHGAGEDEDHSTWLEEDEDVWGSDSEAPPSVLG